MKTDPVGARCTFWRNGQLISDIPSTPGAVTIRKTREDLTIVCDKRGYATATFINHSGWAMSTLANILTGGLAWAVDSTRGADNKYQGDVSLTLAPGAAVPVQLEPSAPPEPSPEPAPPASVPPRFSRPMAPPPVPAAPVAPPPGSQLDCASSDGSRIRVTGSSCPAGFTVAR